MSEFSVYTRVIHPAYGEGIISKVNLTTYEIFFERQGKVTVTKSNEDLEIDEDNANAETEASVGVSIDQLEEAISYVLDKYGVLPEIVPLGEKWKGGTLILQPENDSIKPKEVPIEAFFHKIVMLRDRLRVMEQNINSHEKLSDEEKVHLQQYITRAYGSLTTFNVLFNEKEHYFVGQKK
ncbi:MAG: hypothetical protein MI922_10225 [Bacteroidales bacterium]|nr:hypothetical protein [Bacteroidales bacterium]